MKANRKNIVIAGSGGQGVILAGTVLGVAAAVYEGKYATQAPTYGTETRGSPSKSEVVISDQRIGYPKTEQCDILIAMNQAALNTNLNNLQEDSLVILEQDLVRDIPSLLSKTVRVPSTMLAKQSVRSGTFANIVMLGVLAGASDLVKPESLRAAIQDVAPAGTVRQNLAALDLGIEFVKKNAREMK